MFFQGLKSNIAIQLAFLLVLAMILIDFVVMSTFQKVLLQSEVSKANLFVNTIEAVLLDFPESENNPFSLDFKTQIDAIFAESDLFGVLLPASHDNPIYFGPKNSVLRDDLDTLAGQTIRSGEKTTRYSGKTWGVFWQQSRNLILSAPLYREGNIIAGISIVLPLEGIYKTLRRTQHLLLIYILINTVILTLIGLYRFSKLFLKPFDRLIKRAEDYKDNDELFFPVRKENNELLRLSRALNSMVKRISGDKEKLQKTVLSLEKANINLKQAQQDIIRAEKLASVGRLSSGIAHEIGNPMGIIIGYLELLKQKDITEDDRKEFLLRTESEINRINDIVRQLLDFSRSSDNETKPVSVHDLIIDITDVVKLQPSMSDIDIEHFLSAERDTVIANSDRLRQVFLNLIINAADAINLLENKSNGKLIITSEALYEMDDAADNHPILKIMFTDNGLGISEDLLDNIFDPFFTTKEPGEGTGLGLSVSFMIVEGLGGKIEAGCNKEGRGTTMTVSIPLYDEDNKTVSPN